MAIPTIALSDSLKIARVLNGLWQIADLERDGKTYNLQQAAYDMQSYVEAGMTTFDMADHYGSAEIICGIYDQNYGKGKTQYLTKWVTEPGKTSKEKVRKAVALALQRLQTDSIDLLQYHAWNYADARYLDELFWLQELQEEGLIQNLGLTNFDAHHLDVVLQSGIPIVSNQISYSLLDQRAAAKMTDICLKHHIKILAFGTLAGGLLSEKWLDYPDQMPEEMETWSQMKYKRYIDVAGGWTPFQKVLQNLKTLADQKQISLAHLATRYIAEQPAVGGVIIGARLGHSNRVAQNKQLFDFEWSPEDSQKVQKIIQVLEPIPGNCGDEYRKPPFLTAAGDLSDHLEQLPSPYPVLPIHEGRSKALSGTIWEDLAGFSRATRIGDRILVSGTTATHGNQRIGGDDPEAQAHFIIDKIEGAIQSLGGKIEDVVRTRIYIHNMDDWEPVSRAHGSRFGHIQPANTMVQAGLIGEGYLVEIEAEAVISS